MSKFEGRTARKERDLLFDGPTSALDPEMLKEVLDTMFPWAEYGNDDDMRHARDGFAHQVVDTLVFMEGGRLTFSGSPGGFCQNFDDLRIRRFIG